MQFLIDKWRQLLPALLLMCAGIAAVVGGSRYGIGSLAVMGPGYMPLLCGSCLILFSLFQLANAFRQHLPAVPLPPLRGIAAASGSILLWVLLAEQAGFILASLLQLLLATAAVPHADWRRLLMFCVVVSLSAWVLFVQLLGIPLPALP